MYVCVCQKRDVTQANLLLLWLGQLRCYFVYLKDVKARGSLTFLVLKSLWQLIITPMCSVIWHFSSVASNVLWKEALAYNDFIGRETEEQKEKWSGQHHHPGQGLGETPVSWGRRYQVKITGHGDCSWPKEELGMRVFISAEEKQWFLQNLLIALWKNPVFDLNEFWMPSALSKLQELRGQQNKKWWWWKRQGWDPISGY